MTIFVDLDGTICSENKVFERSLARPIEGAKSTLASLIQEGHEIIIYTARSWSERKMTEEWLRSHEIPYHGLLMGKPVADLWIDDRAMGFKSWKDVSSHLLRKNNNTPESTDEENLRILRIETKKFIEEISQSNDLMGPVLEVGPMTHTQSPTDVFHRMPETLVSSRELFKQRGIEYTAIDSFENPAADKVCSFFDAPNYFSNQKFGSVILLNVIEHFEKIWETPSILEKLLSSDGRAFILTPWNLRFHGPRPDCWRLSDDAYKALFRDKFKIERIDFIECPGRPLSPVGIKCILKKH